MCGLNSEGFTSEVTEEQLMIFEIVKNIGTSVVFGNG